MRPTVIGIALAALSVTGAAVEPQRIVYARVFPSPNQLHLFVASADGSGERPLLTSPDLDYDPAWSPDGGSIVFTSDREGSADLFRVKADGTGLERLTDDPAYDDQAAFSPDGKQLVFVSSRKGGFAHLWTMDLQTRRAQALTPLTTGRGGDFRPAWSPDGRWIAFASDRDGGMPFAHGRWEHLQLVDLYVIHPDGSGLKRVGAHGNFCGSPKWEADSRHVIAYCMTAEQTLANRRAVPEPNANGNDTRLVTFDITNGTSADVAAGAGMKFNPSVVGNTIGFIRKFRNGTDEPGIYYASGTRGPKGDIRAASWSPDGTHVVFHKRVATPPPTWKPTYSRNPAYQLTLTGILPSFSPRGDRFVTTGRPSVAGVPFDSSVVVTTTGTEKSEVVYHNPKSNVLAPQWSPDGSSIIFSVGTFNAFFNGFNGLFLKPGDRAEGGAQVAMVRPDGTGFKELTSGPNNSGFPSMSPDGKRFVYRSFGPDGDGLFIKDIETGTMAMLTKGYDNFPLWSPRGDLIMFSRQAAGDYEIYTIKPDGTGVKRLTFARGNDAHMGWAPDGEHIVFTSSRMGFKDEMTYTDAPQPYGEIFVMRYDGTGIEQLTDNQWEDGTPAWQPNGQRLSTMRNW